MTVWVCSELNSTQDSCLSWVESAHFPQLTVEQSLELGAVILGLFVAAYTVRLLINLFINR